MKFLGRGAAKVVTSKDSKIAILRHNNAESFQKELEILQKVSGTHPHLPLLLGYDASELNILIPRAAYGSVRDYVEFFETGISKIMTKTVYIQVASAARCLGRQGFRHKDLAPRNVLLESIFPVHAVLADFDTFERGFVSNSDLVEFAKQLLKLQQ